MDHLANFASQIKVAVIGKRSCVILKKSKFVIDIANLLYELGFFSEIKVGQRIITVSLKYISGHNLLRNITLVSKRGRKKFISLEDLKKLDPSFTYILSTTEGLLTREDALQKKKGGILIYKI
jgi:ribosomal protein S8